MLQCWNYNGISLKQDKIKKTNNINLRLELNSKWIEFFVILKQQNN